MSTTPANDTTRNPNERDELELVCVPPANRAYDDRARVLLRHGRRQMTPRDLARHYNPEALLHVWAKCDGERGASTHYYPREVYRRQRCETFPDIPGTAPPSSVRSAAESSALYDTTPGELPSVPRSALTASRCARTVTADGCVEITPPDSDRGEAPAAFSSKVRIPEQQAADTLFRFALGGGT